MPSRPRTGSKKTPCGSRDSVTPSVTKSRLDPGGKANSSCGDTSWPKPDMPRGRFGTPASSPRTWPPETR